jgi:hypothetical protein
VLTQVSSKVARWTWCVAYLFFLLAGLVAFFSPSQVLVTVLLKTLVYGWAGFLCVGGMFCFYGRLRNTWSGEIVGLPLLSTSNLIFSVLLFSRATSPATIAIGGIFFGMAIALSARWVEVWKVSKINQGVNNEL